MSKDKKHEKGLDREEYGHGYDLSPDDFDVIGQNEEAKKNNNTIKKDETDNSKHNPSILNQ